MSGPAQSHAYALPVVVAFPAMIDAVIVAGCPAASSIPPESPRPMFPLMVENLIVSVPLFAIPPGFCPAWPALLATVERTIVMVTRLSIPPAWTLETFPLMVESAIATDSVPHNLSLKMPVPALSLTVELRRMTVPHWL